ncbi:hypothetical protein KBZ15_10065 [Cyanobium sp. BA20m-p-22]|nr:hypothetical protein [Cyanobium sp. BA20m-p-22]
MEWLRDRITQMGHHPDLYERWHAEIDLLEEGCSRPSKPERCRPSKRQRRRLRVLVAAGFPDGSLPPGLIYAHGAVMTEQEEEIIGDRMKEMGPLKPTTGTVRYYELAAEHLRDMRRGAIPDLVG